jgi:POT family proton-dependent oligopeptide transporter
MKPISLWTETDTIAAITAVALFACLAIGGVIAIRKSEEVVGHPRGLFVLFYAEMWERFSYYGMRALLVLYLTKHWLFAEGKANLTYALGHLLMAVEGEGGTSDPMINVFWLALSFIIVGSGFLKANISVIVGQLYSLTDHRRDPAYTIFYMGVNVGAALGTILVGYLGETIGWAYGFGLAGIGMVAGLIIFIAGKPALKGNGEPPVPLLRPRELQLYAVGTAAVVVIWLLIQFQNLMGNLLLLAGVGMLAYTLYEAFKLPKEPRERMFAIVFLIALNPVFWGLFEQAGGSLNLYTDRYVDRQGVPASLFQSINPIYIVLLGPLFAGLWTWLGKRGLEPSAPAKFGLALVQVGLSFLVFVWGAESAGMAALTPVIFVFMIYLLQTTGELCLSPVGLSAMTRLSPVHLGSFIMGAWFYMTAVGQFVAGKIGEATGGESGAMSKELTLEIYSKIGWMTIGVAVVVLLVSPVVKRWMHLGTLEDRSAPEDQAGVYGGDEGENVAGALPGRV